MSPIDETSAYKQRCKVLLSDAKEFSKIPMGHPNVGLTRDVGKVRDLQPITHHISETVQYKDTGAMEMNRELYVLCQIK